MFYSVQPSISFSFSFYVMSTLAETLLHGKAWFYLVILTTVIWKKVCLQILLKIIL